MKIDEKDKVYELPIKEKIIISKIFHLMILGTFLFCLFFLYILIDEESSIIIIFVFASLIIFLITIWIVSFFIKPFLIITDESIAIEGSLKKKELKWDEIHDVEIISQGMNTTIGIISKEQIKEMQDSVSKYWFYTLFSGRYYMSFHVNFIRNLNNDILFNTIKYKVFNEQREEVKDNVVYTDLEVYKESSDYKEHIKQKKETEENSSFIKGLFLSLIVALVLGIIGGIIYRYFDFGLLFLSLYLGNIGILYIYHSNYIEEEINIFFRIIIGSVSILPLEVALVMQFFLNSGMPVDYHSILLSIKYTFKYFFESPKSYVIYCIPAIIFFLQGFLSGKSFKFEKYFSKLKMRKKGEYYLKKVGSTIKIYLCDPVDMDEYEGKFIYNINEGCLIEKSSKLIGAFYIPKEYIEESKIQLKYDELTVIENKEYYKLDFQDEGVLQKYVYYCDIICNENLQAEFIVISYIKSKK